ncbi:phospholipase D family protein [Candidatus Bathyarchaeota archaeon]|nr:phospholipase D family protein [Candidatus Bathyarchaeota archaeon]
MRSVPGMDEEAIYYLIGREVLVPTKRAANIAEYKFRVDCDKLKLLEPPQGKAPTDEWHILATYPPGMGFEKIKDVRPLYPDLCRLAIASKREICIVNPFFDYRGRRKLLPYLVSAAKRGVRIRIVSRTQGLDMSDQLRSFVTPLLRIGANVETKTFGLRPDYSVHAKFIVGDGEMAYVGSANLTGRSLSRNVEAGVFVKGKGARVLKDFFDRLWKVARTL